IVLTRLHYFETIFRARTQTGGGSTSVHFSIYGFVPQILHHHPLFGLGLNSFSVYYEQVTGKTNWGPHSFYVALIVETGLVGTALFAVFLWYLFRRLEAGRTLGRLLARAGDPASARLRPLTWGMTAALAGTMVANIFYLTMSFYYFYVFAVLALAAPIVFGRRLARARARRACSSAPRPRAFPGTPRAGSCPTPSSTCGRAASRSTSSRRSRSATSGSRTGTASSATSG